ncbi:hypothetical protein PTKIN_Ptkin02bG0196400 [Pterospermum kingtungense]
MNGGMGKDSYANNSSYQRTVMSMVKPILGESVVELYFAMLPDCLKIADLGCSAGPNTFLLVYEIIDIIEETCQMLKLTRPPCLQAFLNDLPGNDFNTVFKSLPSFYERLEREKGNKFGQCFISGAAGSFYMGDFFPLALCTLFILLMPSCGSPRHQRSWLRKQGTHLRLQNKPSCCVQSILRAIQKRLGIVSNEIVPGGRMVLTTMGSIKSDDPLSIWEFVGLKLHEMVNDGLIEEQKLESFDLPYYTATTEEVKSVIEAEGSFNLQKLEAFNMDWDDYIKKANSNLDKTARAAILAKDIRAVGEPILASHFGDHIMDDLFRRFKEDVLDYMEAHKCQHINIIMSLTKKDMHLLKL